MIESIDVQSVIEATNQFLEENTEVSQEKLAKMAGISGSSLSAFLKGQYAGRAENVAKKVQQVLDDEAARSSAVMAVREPDVVMTTVMREMEAGLQYATNRNDILVVYGAPGIGKTVTLRRWCAGHANSIFFTASPNIHNGRDVMEEVLEAMGKRQTGRNKALEKAIIQALTGTNRTIIIDEAHFLRLSALETLRRIHDVTGVPLILVGNPAILDIINEQNKTLTGQFFSRAVRIALSHKATMDDVKSIVLQNGVDMNQDCLDELYKVASGNGALRVMTKLFLFAWTVACAAKHSIGMSDIEQARKVIISV